MAEASRAEPALTVDARGLACPMPLVRARKAMDLIRLGDVLQVLSTDRGSPADFQSWCLQTEQRFLGVQTDDGFFRLYVQKVIPETREKGKLFDRELTNGELQRRLEAGQPPRVLDVREPDEFQAGHIPGAILTPIEELERVVAELDRSAEIAIVCRSARRSGYACQIMQRLGFQNLSNVVPGMTEWKGSLEREG